MANHPPSIPFGVLSHGRYLGRDGEVFFGLLVRGDRCVEKAIQEKGQEVSFFSS